MRDVGLRDWALGRDAEVLTRLRKLSSQVLGGCWWIKALMIPMCHKTVIPKP